MASVGYGFSKYGRNRWGTPVYHFGAATIAQTSAATAVGTQIDRGAATITATSSVTAAGVQIDLGAATLAQTSSMTGAGIRILRGASVPAATSNMTCLLYTSDAADD